MKTPYAKYWMSADLLHALGPEDDDAELQAWVRADLDDTPAAPTASAATVAEMDGAADSGKPARQAASAPVPPSSSSPA